MIFKTFNGILSYIKAHFRVLSISLGLLFFGIFLLLSLLSYTPIDLIETMGDLNFFGYFGAKVADILLQYFGFASYLLVFALFRISFLVALKGEIERYKIKIFGIFISILILCILFGVVKKYEFSFNHLIGGYIGFLFSESLVNKTFFLPVITVLFFIFIFASVLSLELKETIIWQKIAKKLKFRLPWFKFKKSVPSKLDVPAKSSSVSVVSSVSNASSIFGASQELPKGQNREAFASTKIIQTLKYSPPAISLLALNNAENQKKNVKNLSLTKSTEKELSKALGDFGIEAVIKGSRVGPVITMYEIEPKAGIRAARVVGLAEDIARSLKAKSARISLIPSSSSLAVEIPNMERETVFLRELLDGVEYKEAEFNIPIALGKSIAGDNIIVDLTTMPHLLVAGTTGSGKSVGVNAMILSILYKLSPNECQFIMIDPKMLELSVYNDIPHLLTPVITESEKAVMALKWLTMEMERRYRQMSAFSVRNIFSYNDEILRLKSSKISGREQNLNIIRAEDVAGLQKMPFIVVVIDEMADLMITAGKVIEGYIQRLAQMARAAGIHVIMATQRPSVDVITGVIKANFPTRISYQVSSKIDSRTILGASGAEALLGKGDMLYMQAGAKTYRIHAPFVSDGEVNNIVSALKKRYGGAYDNIKVDIFEDILEESVSNANKNENFSTKGDNDLYSEAVEIVINENKPSISYLQRRLKIGYNKAANLIEKMEADGILSSPEPNTGKRVVLKK